MSILIKDGNHFFENQVLGPELELSSSQANEVFEWCRAHQGLTSGNHAKNEGPLDLSKVNLVLPTCEKVVFFPGSFSPWHKGHQACLLNLPEGESVVVLPDFNPWKEVRDKGLWSEVQEIWKGLIEISKERPDLSISLYLGFLCNQAANPTVEWLPMAIGSRKWLLMGEDTFLGLDKWKRALDVLSALEGIYVCPRAIDEGTVLTQKEKLEELSKQELKIEFLEAHPYQNYSSTWARKHKS